MSERGSILLPLRRAPLTRDCVDGGRETDRDWERSSERVSAFLALVDHRRRLPHFSLEESERASERALARLSPSLRGRPCAIFPLSRSPRRRGGACCFCF